MSAGFHQVRGLILLPSAERYSDFALLLMRLFVGGFLIWGVWDNIVSAERMAEFAQFLARHRFPLPDVAGPLSVWAQFGVGVAFILGLFTRWAGIVCAVHFAVAIAMVDRLGGLRASFPAACLVLIGLCLAANGPGRVGLDRVLDRNWRNGATQPK